MFRCMKPGCPVLCGTRTRPSCMDRLWHRAELLLLTAAFLVSAAMGAHWFHRRAALDLAEPAPVPAPQKPELVGKSQDDAGQRVLGHPDGEPAIPRDAGIKVPKQR